ncbi:KAP family P-loop NTPase fold protein [Lactococcus lactis]|uniref:KAP family P-loop NTPase fold protein n=1 Tax=Lactococcus TaxID=1357 RepID=UPI0025A1C686|nr:P-loop NTPase fold protein [Lactococcus lactis]MDM7659337.1 P-loop NTPase fold protein [Lactococcus lactis]MDQ7172536.1 P-loop NTPase fold protein [Lactococcus lactis]WMM05804.1 P-loop NTPase fold protein [Lactococcus lactis]WMM20405.1 P-loop NTPase fold protein [Lactococcus lactis]WMM21689.1 P-loop NTPase fold protein [Lactococcus lactis]
MVNFNLNNSFGEDEEVFENYHYPELSSEEYLKSAEEDIINRGDAIYNLSRLLYLAPSKAVIALEGEWGTEKTTACKKIENGVEVDEEFKSKYSQVVYFNAWENDIFDAPLQSLFFVLHNKLSKNKKRSKELVVMISELSLMLSNGLLKKLSSGIVNVHGFKKIFSKRYRAKQLNKKIFTISEIREKVNSLIEELNINKKLLIIIDELDRCNPAYAVKVLESIKHFFNNDKVVFLISCDKKELSHIIKGFYGQEFNAYKYLSRFFTISVSLPEFDRKTYVTSLVSKFQVIDGSNFPLGVLAQKFHLSIRDIQRVTTQYFMVKGYVYASATNNTTIGEQVAFALIQYLLILKNENGDKFQEFLLGENFEEFFDIMKAVDEKNEAMKQDFEIIHEQLVRAYKHVTPFYDYSDDDELLLKKSQIYNEIKKLIEALTMISYSNSY